MQTVAAHEQLVLGIHPYLPALELQKRFAPLTEYLSEAIGRPVIIKVSPSYHEHIHRVVHDEVDIAYMGPAVFVKALNQQPLLDPMARLEVNGKPFFYGKIVTREGSGIETVMDLKGKKFAFGDKSSTMSHLVPRYTLNRMGVMDVLGEYAFLGSHNNVALGVLLGKYDAGAIKEGVFLKYRNRGLRLVQNTDAVSEHLFVATGRLNEEWRLKIKNTLLKTRASNNGLQILRSIKPTVTNLVAVESGDYDNLNQIMLKLSMQ